MKILAICCFLLAAGVFLAHAVDEASIEVAWGFMLGALGAAASELGRAP